MKNKIIAILILTLCTSSLYSMRIYDELDLGFGFDLSPSYSRPTTPEEFRHLAQNLLLSNVNLDAPNPLFCDEPPLLRLSYHEECADIIEALLKKGANPNISYERRIPLQIAVREKAEKNVKILLEHGADTNKPHDTDKRNVLPGVLRDQLTGSWTPTEINKTKEIVKLLLTYKGNIDGTGNLGMTSLHQVVDKEMAGFMTMPQHVRKYFVGLLLYHAANTKLKKWGEKTAAEYARINGFPEFAHIIENCHKPLVAKMTRLLSYTGNRGKGHSPFIRDIAFFVARWHYRNTGT